MTLKKKESKMLKNFVFPIFSLLALKFAYFRPEIGFLVQNCTYSHLGMSRIPQPSTKFYENFENVNFFIF